VLENVPYSVLIGAAVLLGLAPFIPEPHLVEKIKMLLGGELKRPLDIFDLLLHSAPLFLIALKWITSKFP